MSFRKVARIVLGSVILLAAAIMLFFSLFVGSFDAAYAMFALLVGLLGLILVVFGVASLPKKR